MMFKEPQPKHQNRPWIKILILMALATGVLGLQAYCLGRSEFVWSVQIRDGSEQFFSDLAEDEWRRFCTRLLHLDDKGSLEIHSGTICDDEILLTVKKGIYGESRFHNDFIEQYELWRINRGTGRVKQDRISPNFLDLISDGHEVWKLNADRTGHQHSLPFYWDGRPFLVAKCKDDGLFQFFDWSLRATWEAQDRFLLLPQISLVDHFDIHSISIAADNSSIHFLATERNDLVAYSYAGHLIGTQTEAEQFSQTNHIPHTKLSKQLADLGWTRTQFEFKPNSTWNGIWMHDADINLIEVLFQDDSHPYDSNLVPSFQWSRYRNGQIVESRTLQAPSSICKETTLGYDHKPIFTFASATGEPFFAWTDNYRRLHVMTLQNDQLRVIAQHADLQIVFHLLIAARDSTCCIFFPSLMLGMFAGIIQAVGRRSPSMPVIDAELASTVRRGLARTIDLAIPVSIFASALVLHPDAICWSTAISEYASYYLPEALEEVASGLNWERLRKLQGTGSHLLSEAVSPPLVWWLMVPGWMFLIAQIVWQGRTGQTLGKWLVGLKVVRPDGRRCGIPRSLLRELLLAVDSLFLLSWVPGVISILATTNSQRPGDLAADTIVVRVRLTKGLPVDSPNTVSG